MALTNLSQITTSGIATGTDLNIRNITGAAATFTGNVTVGGTLTYDDVTNIDSVGLITARSGINVTSGDVNLTSGNLALASATPMVVASNGSGHLRLGAGGLEKVRISSAGLVGIGTNNPTSALEIRTTTTNSATNYRNDASDAISSGVYFGVRGTDLGAASAGDAYIYSYNSGINLLADGNGDINFATGGTASRLRITSGGDVGIGTDTPYANNSFNSLSIGGSGKYGLIELNKSNGVAGSWIDVYGTNGNGDLRITTAGTSGAITFWTGGSFTEKLRITSDGKVGIGTVTPEEELCVQLDSSSDGPTLRLRNANGGDGTYTGRISTGDAQGTFFAGINFLKHDSNDGEIRFRTKVAGSNTDVVTIVDGNIGVAGATGTDYSLLDGMVINTANGSAGLLINSSSSSHNAYMSFGYGSGSGTSHADQFSAYIGRVGDDTLILGTNNNIRVRVSSGGQVHLTGANTSTTGTSATDLLMANSAAIRFRKGDNSAWINSVGLDSNNNLKLGWGGSTSEIHFGISGIGDQMKLDSGGRLIIGSATSSNAWVGGDDLIIGNTTSGTRSGITLVSGSNTDGGLYWSDGNSGTSVLQGQLVYNHSNSRMQFYTAAAARVTIDSAGRLLIGRVTNLQSSSERLTVDSGMGIIRNNSTSTAALYLRNEDSTADTRHPYLNFTDGSGNRGGIGIQNDASSMWIHGQNGIAFRTSGTSPGSAERLKIHSSGATTMHVNNEDHDTFRFTTQGADEAKLIMRDASDNDDIVLNTGGDSWINSADFGIGTNSPGAKLDILHGTSDGTVVRMRNDEVGIVYGVWGTGSSYPRETSINGTRFDSGSSPFLRIAGQGGIKFCVDLNNERLRIDSNGRIGINANPTTYANSDTALGLLIRNGSSSNDHVYLDLQNEQSESGRIRFVDGDNGIAGQIYFAHNTARGGVGGNCMGFFTGSNTLRMQVTTTGVNVHGSTDGVLNIDTTDGRGAFIRFKENENTKAWVGCAEGMGGGLASPDQDDLGLMAVGKILFSANGAERLRIDEDGGIIKGFTNSATSSQVIQTFFNKRGSCKGKRVHQGASSGSTNHDLLTINSWQSSNTRLFAYVTVHYVNPISNLGGRMETYAGANQAGSRTVGTFAIADGGRWGNPSGTLSLSWSGNTLELNTFNNAYMEYSVDITYVAYDGASVTFATN